MTTMATGSLQHEEGYGLDVGLGQPSDMHLFLESHSEGLRAKLRTASFLHQHPTHVLASHTIIGSYVGLGLVPVLLMSTSRRA